MPEERKKLFFALASYPGEQGRKSIWNTLLPELPMKLVTDLSGKFDLSGGQIENISTTSASITKKLPTSSATAMR